MIKITEIKTEYKVNALGVDGSPLIRWKYSGGEQTSYRLKVRLSAVYGKGEIVVFDSGEVESSDNFCRADGSKFERGKRYDVIISLNGEKATDGGDNSRGLQRRLGESAREQSGRFVALQNKGKVG